MNKLKILSSVTVGLWTASILIGCGKSETVDKITEEQRLAEALSEEETEVSTASATGEGLSSQFAISTESLKRFLPNLREYTTTGEPKAVKMDSEGIEYSVVEQDYKSGEKSVQVIIADYNYIDGLNASYSMLLGLTLENNQEVTRSESISGFKGWANYRKDNSKSTIGIAIADRIWVIVEGQNGVTIDEVREIVKSMNLASLAKAT